MRKLTLWLNSSWQPTEEQAGDGPVEVSQSETWTEIWTESGQASETFGEDMQLSGTGRLRPLEGEEGTGWKAFVEGWPRPPESGENVKHRAFGQQPEVEQTQETIS